LADYDHGTPQRLLASGCVGREVVIRAITFRAKAVTGGVRDE
jgi:hypothetical protein